MSKGEWNYTLCDVMVFLLAGCGREKKKKKNKNNLKEKNLCAFYLNCFPLASPFVSLNIFCVCMCVYFADGFATTTTIPLAYNKMNGY